VDQAGFSDHRINQAAVVLLAPHRNSKSKSVDLKAQVLVEHLI
jgi:hypothetical protein